jgi:hypothetical protein
MPHLLVPEHHDAEPGPRLLLRRVLRRAFPLAARRADKRQEPREKRGGALEGAAKRTGTNRGASPPSKESEEQAQARQKRGEGAGFQEAPRDAAAADGLRAAPLRRSPSRTSFPPPAPALSFPRTRRLARARRRLVPFCPRILPAQRRRRPKKPNRGGAPSGRRWEEEEERPKATATARGGGRGKCRRRRRPS